MGVLVTASVAVVSLTLDSGYIPLGGRICRNAGSCDGCKAIPVCLE